MNIIDLEEVDGVYVPTKAPEVSKKGKSKKEKSIVKTKAPKDQKIEVRVVQRESPQATPAEDFVKGIQAVLDIFNKF